MQFSVDSLFDGSIRVEITSAERLTKTILHSYYKTFEERNYMKSHLLDWAGAQSLAEEWHELGGGKAWEPSPILRN